MKRIAGFMFITMLCTGIAFAMMSPKELACKQSCKEALEKCKKDAGSSMVKKAACDAANKKCLKKCEKK